MTDIQLPLQHQNHQKGMNGKYSAKNLEIRGFSGNNTNTSQIVNVTNETKAANSNTIGSAAKKSLKIIAEKTAPTTNFQVLRFNPNNEFGTLVSVIDVNPNLAKSRNSFNRSNNNNNNKMEYNTNTGNNSNNILNNYSEIVQFNSLSNNPPTRLDTNQSSTNLLNTNLNTNLNNNGHQQTTGNGIRNPFWNDESNSGWTGTGVMSDRSSVYSIDDGDFDREASRKVNNQLREIESILYEQNSQTPSSNQNECNEWLEKFPHIRVLGKQILNTSSINTSSKDTLDLSNSNDLRLSMQSMPPPPASSSSTATLRCSQFNTISNQQSSIKINHHHHNYHNRLDSSSPIPSQQPYSSTQANLTDQLDTNSQTPAFNNYKYFRRREASDLNCNQLLNVYGTSMSIKSIAAIPNAITDMSSSSSSSEGYSAFEEEIFDQEGVYEELLAYDNQEEEYMFEHNKRLNLNKRRRHGLPPITPKAAMKDLVANFLFDHMWSELIDWSADTIKTYAKAISDEFMLGDEASCKTPQLVSTPNPDYNENLLLENNNNNSKSLLLSSTNTNSNVSPSYSSLMHNNTYVTNESVSITAAVNANSSNANATVIATNPIATSVTKANIIQLKLFDSQLYPIQSYTPSLLTRDNSNLYAGIKNQQQSTTVNDNHSSYSNEQTGDLMTKDLLQIKQLNRNGSSTGDKNKDNNSNKSLNPIMLSQSRINSGNRRQLQINYYRKRYSSIEMGANAATPSVDKNIIIHGAGFGKPVNHFSAENTNSTPQNNPFLHFSNSSGGASNNSNVNSFGGANRSTNNSSQAYNHLINDENIYENEFNDYNLYEQNTENSIDEINLLNQQSSSSSNNMAIVNSSNASKNNNNNNTHGTVVAASANNHYNHSHLNYFGFHQHNSHLSNHANFQPLPPIENSLTLKPIRISSANISNNTSGLKQIKERNERPMTSTATRFDLNGIPSINSAAYNKRSTTPSGLTSANKGVTSKKINNVRQSPDDSIFLNNFLSTKSFNFLMNNNNNNSNGSNTNGQSMIQSSSSTNQARRNSIKADSHSLTRVYR